MDRMAWSAVALSWCHFAELSGGRDEIGEGRPRREVSEAEKMERELRQPVAQTRTSARMLVPSERASDVGFREVMASR